MKQKLLIWVQAVERFVLSPAAAAAHIAALAQLTASRVHAPTGDDAKVSASMPHTAAAWGSTVLQAAEEELGRFVEQVGFGVVSDAADAMFIMLYCVISNSCHLESCCAQQCACKQPPFARACHQQTLQHLPDGVVPMLQKGKKEKTTLLGVIQEKLTQASLWLRPKKLLMHYKSPCSAGCQHVRSYVGCATHAYLLLQLDAQVGDASIEGSSEAVHGMTATEWRVATALFTAGEVSATGLVPCSQAKAILQRSDSVNSILEGTVFPGAAHAYTQLTWIACDPNPYDTCRFASQC